jgi:hypothetical protein
MGTMSFYGLYVNIGTMMSIAHGGNGAWTHGEMANTWALATARSGDLRWDSMKFYRSTPAKMTLPIVQLIASSFSDGIP